MILKPVVTHSIKSWVYSHPKGLRTAQQEDSFQIFNKHLVNLFGLKKLILQTIYLPNLHIHG